MRAAMALASAASPSMMGTIGCVPVPRSNPADDIFFRKRAVLASSRSRSAVLDERMSKTASDAPATAGARVFEKR